jgi:serine/threonine protein phosphatase PrpC
MNIKRFRYSFEAAAGLDQGKIRASNQDRIISCEELGFFGVSDGMGGMPRGGETSEYIEKKLPGIAWEADRQFAEKDAAALGAYLQKRIGSFSDALCEKLNTGGQYLCGATLCCVMLQGSSGVFINLGDSRGFLLKKGEETPRQITADHNLAAEYVAKGILTREQTRNHHASSQLLQYMGMDPPAIPDCFIEELGPGDAMLLCSDGLHGLVGDAELGKLLRLDKDPDTVCKSLIEAANNAGGNDNICVVYIRIN